MTFMPSCRASSTARAAIALDSSSSSPAPTPPSNSGSFALATSEPTTSDRVAAASRSITVLFPAAGPPSTIQARRSIAAAPPIGRPPPWPGAIRRSSVASSSSRYSRARRSRRAIRSGASEPIDAGGSARFAVSRARASITSKVSQAVSARRAAARRRSQSRPSRSPGPRPSAATAGVAPASIAASAARSAARPRRGSPVPSHRAIPIATGSSRPGGHAMPSTGVDPRA